MSDGLESDESSQDFAAIGRVELIEKYRDHRHDLALEFDESPEKFRLMVEMNDEGALMLVKENDE